jgi:GNAT superfamily N-acetyltransferase
MTDFRVMKESDLDFFMQLMDMVGWGMTPGDYDRILRFSPWGCFIAGSDGEDLGMVASVNYGDIAWIGNLVVLPMSRGQGIGAKLMQHAMDYLVSTGTKSIRLDGVQMAIPLYHRLGFRDEYWSLRYTGVARKHPETTCKSMRKEDLNEVTTLDLSVFKASRRDILEYFYGLYPELCFTAWDEGELVGYIMAKQGKDQVKIGPWIAKRGYHSEAEQLLDSVMNQRVGANLWVGVPEANKASISILEENGFTSLPSSLRMCYGGCRVVEDVISIFGLGGPDKG